METRTVFLFIFKVAVLVFVLFVIQAAISVLIGFEVPSERSFALGPLIVSYVAQACVMSYFTLRSSLRGWKLYGVVFLLFFGITTVLTQVETWVFLQRLVEVVPEKMVPLFFLQGLLTSSIFAFAVVVMYRRLKHFQVIFPLVYHRWEFKKLLFLAFLYVVFYFAFGFLVFRPLAGEVFQEFYANLERTAQNVFLPIIFLQVLRGLVFALLAFLVIRVVNAKRSEKILLVALLFVVLMGFLLLPPNPYLPDRIRLSHFVEVTTANFLFGWIAGWLLSGGKSSLQGQNFLSSGT